MKGDGEAHPFLSPNDEFADYETWDKGNLDGSVAKKKEMLEFEYTRSALKNGLKLEAKLGANPYKFGLVGSSDAHTGLAVLRGGQFLRQDHAAGAQRASPDRHLHEQPEDRRENHGLGSRRPPATPPCGPRKTRAPRSSTPCSARKPTPPPARASSCASSAAGILKRPTPTRANPPSLAIAKASRWAATWTMPRRRASRPRFLAAAMKDPLSGNLDRIQIIKGWLDAKGETQEKVYDVAWSGDRKPDGRQAPERRQHRRCRERDVDEHHRRARVDHRLERPGLRSSATGLLLRARHRNPHAALDRLRREKVRRQDRSRACG